MTNKYGELVNMTNKIIENQMKNPKNKIKNNIFGSDAHDNTPDNRKITLHDIKNIVEIRGIDFDKPFDLAFNYINIQIIFIIKDFYF